MGEAHWWHHQALAQHTNVGLGMPDPVLGWILVPEASPGAVAGLGGGLGTGTGQSYT